MAIIGAIVFGALYAYNTKKIRFIPFYALASFAESGPTFYYMYLYKHEGRKGTILVHTISSIFIILEFVLLTNFQLSCIVSERKKRLVRILGYLIILYVIFYAKVWSNSLADFRHFKAQMDVLESFYLVIPCIFYLL